MSVVEASNLAEERLAACLLLHPAVASLGASFQNQVGATLKEEIKQSYVNGGFPFLNKFADSLTTAILHKWYTNSQQLKVAFDISGVDYTTGEDKGNEFSMWIDAYEGLSLKREWVAGQLGIPEEALDEIPERGGADGDA